jgi:glycine reductase
VFQNIEVNQVKRVLFYTNQFFGQVGGEEKANTPPEVRQGPVGPGSIFSGLLDGEIVATIVCGDNFYAEDIYTARDIIYPEVVRIAPDIFIAGPAFIAGRFGVACGDLCSYIAEKSGIPTVTGLNEENPAADMYKSKTIIVRTGRSAAGMKKAVAAMAAVANKLLNGLPLGLPDEDGYFPRGVRENVFKDKTGAERALDMLMAKLRGEPYRSEIPIPVYDRVAPAPPIQNLKTAKLALVTSAGIVPINNPDRLPAATAKFFKSYDISGVDSLKEGEYESVHAGYDPVYANKDPNRVAPLDLMKKMAADGEIGELYPRLITTTGNSTSVADAKRMGVEIAVILKENGVDGAILTST